MFPSNSTWIIDLSEILNFDNCIFSNMESKTSTGEFARNPSLPLFKPIIGIDNLPISSADLKIVPSPPIEIPKSIELQCLLLSNIFILSVLIYLIFNNNILKINSYN